jgi:chemotaxis protein methyltransferase CheR
VSDIEGPTFELTDADFVAIRTLAKDRAGINISDGKRSLIYGRLARRLRQLRLDSFAAYLPLLSDPAGTEATEFINALTTNVTEFFRESHHFDFLAQTALPALCRNASRRRLRIWSAGCSTGEEPYTLAIALHEAIPDLAQWDVKILATDIDSEVLTHGAAGAYMADRVKGLSPARLDRWFVRQRGARDQVRFQAKPELRNLITFKRLNLLESWPMRGPFDAIFCRNVIIYFDLETKMELVSRFRSLLGEGCHMFLGHSESLVTNGLGFTGCGRTIYRKCAVEAEAA